jgi:hypothetical protein
VDFRTDGPYTDCQQLLLHLALHMFFFKGKKTAAKMPLLHTYLHVPNPLGTDDRYMYGAQGGLEVEGGEMPRVSVLSE